MIPYLNRILGGLLIVACIFGAVQTYRLDSAKDFHREFVMANQENLIELGVQRRNETARADKAQAEIGNKYNEGVRDADTLSQTTIARLTNDLRGVQKHWQSALRRASSAEAALAGSELDAAADAMSADLAGFVRGAAKGDATIVSLQDQVNLYLCQVNGEPFPGYKCTK